MTKFLFANVISLLYTIAFAQDTALPPVPQEEHLARSYNEARAGFMAASDSQYLDFPAEAKPWPCAPDDRILRSAAGALADGELPALLNRQMVMAMRNAGVRAKDNHITIDGVRTAPLVASCRDGKLDGTLEFLIEYRRTTDTPVVNLQTLTRKRVRVVMKNGQVDPAAPLHTAEIISKYTNTYKDATMQAVMAKQPDIGMTTLMVVSHIPVSDTVGHQTYMSQARYAKKPLDPVITGFTTPVDESHAKSVMYRGADLWMTYRTLDGLYHGEMETLPTRYGQTTLPGSKICYENGEQIKTTNCVVE